MAAMVSSQGAKATKPKKIKRVSNNVTNSKSTSGTASSNTTVKNNYRWPLLSEEILFQESLRTSKSTDIQIRRFGSSPFPNLTRAVGSRSEGFSEVCISREQSQVASESHYGQKSVFWFLVKPLCPYKAF